MKGAIEKEELRGRINKILRDEIGRELLDMTADKIIDMLFSENLPNPQEPRIGQICKFWDDGAQDNSVGAFRGVWTEGFNVRFFDGACWWKHARVLRDPLTLGRTLAPDGAEWVAPYKPDMWAFLRVTPDIGGPKQVVFGGEKVRNSSGHVQTFPAPTEGREPIKLWED